MTFWKSVKLGFGLGVGITLASIIIKVALFFLGVMLAMPMDLPL